MTRLLLTEFIPSSAILSPATVHGLVTGIPELTVQPSPVQGTYRLTPGSRVGIARVGELEFEVRPKIGVQRLMFLISYALDPVAWRDEELQFDSDADVLEAVAMGFMRQLARVFRRGLLQGYRTNEDASNTIKGRIDFTKQLRKQYGMVVPVHVIYDDYTVDTDAHRIIKAALRRLQGLPLRSGTLLDQVTHAWNQLALVSDMNFTVGNLPTVIYNRLNDHYRPVVELSRLILQSSSYELREGRVAASGFFVDMNKVFETFVITALREELGLTEREFPQGARGRSLWLDEQRSISLEPDISWWRGQECVFVGDVKYKSLEDGEVVNADLYQLLAYAIATRLPGGTLLYAAGAADVRTYTVCESGKELRLQSLDLMQSPKQMLQQFASIAGSIRSSNKHEFAPRHDIRESGLVDP